MKRRLTLLAFAMLAVVGCGPRFSLITGAPPNRVARLDLDNKRIEVSEGVAVALECYREGSACKDVKATSSDPKIARVFPAHLTKVTRGLYEQGNVSTAAIVGVAPGKATIHVVSEGSTTDYEVDVLPAPR